MLVNPATLHISISHGEDIDGFTAQVLLKKYFQSQNYENFELYRKSYDNLKEFLQKLKIRNFKSTTFYITDLDFNPQYQQEVLSLVQNDGGNSLLYIDHHASTRSKEHELNHLPNVRCITGADNQCTTFLIQQTFFPNDPTAIALAEEARHSDKSDTDLSQDNIWLRRLIAMRAAKNLSDPDLEKIFNALESPGFYSLPWLQALITQNKISYQNELKKILTITSLIQFGKILLRWCTSKIIFPGDIAREIQNHFPVDLSVGLDFNGKISIKSRNPMVSAAQIASFWGGGGHDDSAGFSVVNKNYNPNDFVSNEFIPKLRNYMKKKRTHNTR